MPTLLKQEKNGIDSSPESCNGKIKPQLSSLSLTISVSLSLHLILSILVSSFWPLLLHTANYVSKKFNTCNLQFHNFYSCIMNFFIFDLTYIFCLYFLDSFNYEDSLMKYLHNRNNYSFHSFDCDICLDYVIVTFVLIM